MYLVDTNIWLERLLDQARSGEVGAFLDRTASNQLFITDFAFHSIGVILNRLKRLEALTRFVQDTFVDGDVTIVHLEPEVDSPRVRLSFLDNLNKFART